MKVNTFECSVNTFLFLLYLLGEYLMFVKELLELYGTSGPTIVVRRYELDLNGNYRNVLRRIKNSGESSFVVVGSLNTLPELLKQVNGKSFEHLFSAFQWSDVS